MPLRTDEVTVVDCGEPLVDVREFGLVAHPVYFEQGLSDDARVRVRVGVARRLQNAQAGLPEGTRLLILDGYRSASVQLALYAAMGRQLAARYPNWDESTRARELQRFVARPRGPDELPAPHATGGAVDLTLMDADGLALAMGSEFDELSPRSYTDALELSAEERQHRAWLIGVMQAQGFTNYPTEWWHWGIGDPLSVALRGETLARYGAVADRSPRRL